MPHKRRHLKCRDVNAIGCGKRMAGPAEGEIPSLGRQIWIHLRPEHSLATLRFSLQEVGTLGHVKKELIKDRKMKLPDCLAHAFSSVLRYCSRLCSIREPGTSTRLSPEPSPGISRNTIDGDMMKTITL